MANEKTPLEQIKAEVREYLGTGVPEITRVALDAFLVQAFDAGSKAQRELDAEVARTDAEAQG